MLYEKPIEKINAAMAAVAIFLVGLPLFVLMGLTEAGRWLARRSWWQWYWGRVQWHEAEARRAKGQGQMWRCGRHWLMFWLLGFPVWLPLLGLALWSLEAANRR